MNKDELYNIMIHMTIIDLYYFVKYLNFYVMIYIFGN